MTDVVMTGVFLGGKRLQRPGLEVDRNLGFPRADELLGSVGG